MKCRFMELESNNIENCPKCQKKIDEIVCLLRFWQKCTVFLFLSKAISLWCILTIPSFELDSSGGYDSLAVVVISSSMSPIMVSASDDVVLGTDLDLGGFCRFPSATNSLCGGFIANFFFSRFIHSLIQLKWAQFT